MSARHLPKLRRWVPLWKRVVNPHPKYVPGDPQMRIYLPNWWMKMLRPDENTPKEIVKFEVHPQMTVNDITQYLEKIYKVEVNYVVTGGRKGEDKLHPKTGSVVDRHPDKKLAYVSIKGEPFEFPDLFKEKTTEHGRIPKDYKKIRNEEEKQKQKDWQLSDIPSWFR